MLQLKMIKKVVKKMKKAKIIYELDYSYTSLYDTLVTSATSFPNNIAYNYFKKTCNYKNFLKKVDVCAKAFKATGIKKRDVVTICMPNTPEAVITFYALNKIGAIANIIHPLSAVNEIKNFLMVSNSIMLVTIDFAFDKVKSIVRETKVLQTVVVAINNSMRVVESTVYYIKKGRKYKVELGDEAVLNWGEFIHKGKGYVGTISEHCTKDDVAAILYSGGTSGISKGIVLSNFSFNALAKQCISVSGLKPKDTILSIMPIFHGFGLGVCIHTFVLLGGTMILVPQFSAKRFDKLLKQYRPNALVGVPTLFETLISNKHMKRVNLSYIKFAISGGDTLSASLRRRIDDFFIEHNADTRIREGYGLTECVSACCLTPSNSLKQNSIGLPFPDMQISIMEINSCNELLVNQIGEICVNGPTVMQKYLNNQDETDNTLKRHKDKQVWLHTGDLGYKDKDGYIYFVQRMKRLIISSGYNIYPSQIENVLNEYPTIESSTVVGIPHPYKMQVVKAFIILKPGIADTKREKENIKDYCIKNIAKYALPYEYEYRVSLPRTKIGKVDYCSLMGESDDKVG